MSILSKIFGTKNDRELKRMHKSVALVNALESEIESLSDEQLAAKTQEFKQRVEQGESLDKLLVEAFAVVREAGKRSLAMRHFDSQLVGGITLHEGRIAEMRTGEGKTLVATLPAYLNALTGNSVHLVTVNDYLAKRDAGWMGPLYEKLGLSVGVVVPGQDGAQKRDAYLADIVYGTNNEFGFDYLRDNMAFSVEEKVQRRLAFAVIDEVDSILIDEARTPLIISGAVEDSSAQYKTINRLIPLLNEQEFVELTALDEKPEDTGHFIIDEKQRSIELTEMGHEYVEDWLGQQDLIKPGESLYAGTNLSILHHVHAALKAHKLFLNDDHYIIQDGQVVIIDENTGRAMPGRRWSEGIHQAIEAKEGLNIQNESQTLASTTFQNYFRLYDKLSGMTGTADTEAFEFKQIYGLDVVLIPTNKPMVRDDQNDLVYLSMAEKYEAIADYIEEIREKNAPVLVGTASIESSELLSKLLKQKKVPHSVLNAKFHEKEASIIAQAGTPGTVTIATNMAGRGTDIVLGGNWEFEANALKNPTQKQRDKLKAEWQKSHDMVLAAGGLHVIGSERHESRRIDNQLRGRSGRQGDPGLTRFFLSLEDNLMRIFASDRVRNLMQRMGMEHGEAIEARMVNNAIEKAQRKVEGRNFDIRKQLLEYDDVANDQRQVIYQQRNELMESDDISDAVNAIRYDVINDMIDGYIPPQSLVEQWDIEGLTQELRTELGAEYPIAQWLENDKELYEEPLREKILKSLVDEYAQKEEQVGEDIRVVEKQLMLQILDSLWKEHLAAMDHLRQGIHLRAYAQKKPQQEYKRESFELFQDLLSNMKHELVKVLTRVQIRQEDEAAIIERQRREAMAQKMQFQHAEANALAEGEPDEGEPEDKEDHTPFVRRDKKVGRNDICPCGSGKKFKQCHGKLA